MTLTYSLTAQESTTLRQHHKSMVIINTDEQSINSAAKHINGTTPEQTITCRQIFEGHLVTSQLMKTKKKYMEYLCMLSP